MLTPKPTRRHSNQRKLLTRWMGTLSSFVQHYEFLDVFLEPFQWFSSLTIRLGSRAPWQNEVKRRLRTKALQLVKARPFLVACDPRSVKISSQSLGSLLNPGNTDERKEVVQASRQLVQPNSNSEVGYSQVSRQENVPIAAGNSMREDQLQTHCVMRGKHSNSDSTRRLVASTPELRNMEYTNHQHMSKIFHFCRRDWECQNQATQHSQSKSYKTHALIWRMFMSSSMNAAIHLGPNYVSNSEIHKNTKFEEIESLFNITQKGIEEHSEEILNVRSLDFTHHHHGQDLHWSLMRRSSWRRQKLLRRFRSVCWSDGTRTRSNRKMERPSWRSQKVFVVPRRSGWSMEKQLNSRRKISQDFHHCLFFKRSKKTWRAITSSPKSSRTGSSLCQCSMTLIGKRNDENCISNAEKIKNYAMKFSQGPWTFLGMEVLFTLKKRRLWFHSQQNVITIQRNWSSCVRKYQCLGSSNLEAERKVKHPYASMEIQQTQNSCSKQFILSVSSVFTEQWRIGAINSAWRKKRDELVFLRTTRCWQVYNREKYNSWYLFRQWHLEAGCEKTFWASKHWPVEFSSHNYVKKLTSNIVWQRWRSTKFDLTGTVGELSLLFAWNTHFLDLFLNPKSRQRFPKAQPLDQLGIAIPSIVNLCEHILHCDIERNSAFL